MRNGGYWVYKYWKHLKGPQMYSNFNQEHVLLLKNHSYENMCSFVNENCFTLHKKKCCALLIQLDWQICFFESSDQKYTVLYYCHKGKAAEIPIVKITSSSSSSFDTLFLTKNLGSAGSAFCSPQFSNTRKIRSMSEMSSRCQRQRFLT